MSAWPIRKLGDVVEINPRQPKGIAASQEVSFVPMAAVDEIHGAITDQQVREFGAVSKGFPTFTDGDVLFAKITPCMENGKAAIASNLVSGIGAGSTEFYVLRPGQNILPEYVFHFVRRLSFRAACKANFTGTAGQQRVPRTYLEKVMLPLPPLEEQRRIVGLLDRAAEIRRRADASRAKARAIIPALFLDMFGDPATNPKGWSVDPLGDHIWMVGGGTPSKKQPDFWGGDIPWISPKDMKPAIVSDSEDKITAAAMMASPVRLIPPENVLIVVRGMILAHTVPIRLNSIAVTLNQDMKALVPDQALNATFLRWLLQSAHGYLLGKVRESAHGTKKLETAILMTFPAMLPPLPLQTAFAKQAQRLETMARTLDAAAAKAEATAAALSAKAFGASPKEKDNGVDGVSASC